MGYVDIARIRGVQHHGEMYISLTDLVNILMDQAIASIGQGGLTKEEGEIAFGLINWLKNAQPVVGPSDS